MNKRNKQRWVNALRSGEYAQTSGVLCDADSDGESFCCLGVAFDVLCEDDWEHAGDSYWGIRTGEGEYPLLEEPDGPIDEGLLPPRILETIGLSYAQARTLVAKNDADQSFKRIANWIEKNL